MSDGMIQSIKTDAEVEGMGYVLYKSWHETYTGLIDPSYLAGITLERGVLDLLDLVHIAIRKI